MYDIKRWFAFYSSQIEFVHQAGGQLQKVDNANTPIPEILLGVPWRHQTVIVSKCDTINEALFYLNKVVENNMSRTELEYVVKSPSRSNGWGYAKRKLKLEEYIRGVGSTSKGTQNRNRMYGGVRGRKTKVGEKLLRFPATRLVTKVSQVT